MGFNDFQIDFTFLLAAVTQVIALVVTMAMITDITESRSRQFPHTLSKPWRLKYSEKM